MLIKKLVKLGMIIFLLSAITKVLISYFPISPFYGNITLLNKINDIKSLPKINAVFIGDSKIENQINPFIFDSVTGKNISSYNLGCKGLGIPESYKVLDEIMLINHVKYIIYELRCVYHTQPQNLHITRTIYYQNWQLYSSSLLNTFYANLPFLRKISVITTHTISFIEYLFNFTFVQGIISYESNNYDNRKIALYSINKGFDIPDTVTYNELKYQPNDLLERKNVAQKYVNQYASENYLYYNKYYTDILQHYSDIAKKNNFKLIYLLPSSLREFEYVELFPVIKNLKNCEIIIMTDGNKFPELYEVKNNLEVDHLNRDGSEIFSKYIGQEFNKIIHSQNIK